MARKRTTTKKTTTNKNKNTNNQKVIVNVNSSTPSSSRTTRKGTQSFTKGNSYLGGSSLRAVNYPGPTVINNMPAPSPVMFPQVENNRINSIENLAQNLATQVQHLYGRINASPNIEIKNVMPQMPEPMRNILTQSRILRNEGVQTSTQPRLETQFSHVLPSTLPMETGATGETSSTTTPSFGGSSSSSGGSGGSGGGDLPVRGSPMQSVVFNRRLHSVKENSSSSNNNSDGDDGNGGDSVASYNPENQMSPMSGLASRLSRVSLRDTDDLYPSQQGPILTPEALQSGSSRRTSRRTTINLNPSQQGTVGTTEIVQPPASSSRRPSRRTTVNLNPSQQGTVGTTDVVQPPPNLSIRTQRADNDNSPPSSGKSVNKPIWK